MMDDTKGDALLNLVNITIDTISIIHCRVLALQIMVERANLTTAEEIDAKMQALNDVGTLEVEFAPEYGEFRRLRRLILQADENPKDKGNQPDG